MLDTKANSLLLYANGKAYEQRLTSQNGKTRATSIRVTFQILEELKNKLYAKFEVAVENPDKLCTPGDFNDRVSFVNCMDDLSPYNYYILSKDPSICWETFICSLNADFLRVKLYTKTGSDYVEATDKVDITKGLIITVSYS